MPSYDPNPFVKVNGVTWTDDTLNNVQITSGRTNPFEQPRAGYSTFTIVTADGDPYPEIEIDQEVVLGVLDTSAAEKVLFTGRVSDINVSLAAFGDTGYLTNTQVTAVGLIALANRRPAGAEGYSVELDGKRVERIIGEAVGLDYPEYNEYYDISDDPTIRTNLVLNPSIEVNTNGFTGSNTFLARVTTDAYVGSASLEVTTNSTGANLGVTATRSTTYQIPVTFGDTFTISAYVKNTSGSRNWRIDARGKTTAATASAIEIITGTAATNPTTWTRISNTFTFTDPSVAWLEFYIRSSISGQVGNKVLVDGVLIEKNSTLGDYFDGSTYNEPVYWSGTANDSTSIYEPAAFSGAYVVAGTQTWATLDPSLTTFDAGSYDILAYSAGATNAYQLASTVANSAAGVIYETNDGKIGYKDAESRTDETVFLELPANVIMANGIRTKEALADIANDVTVVYGANLSTQDEDTTSIGIYGRLAAKVSTVLNALDDADALLEYYLNTKAFPRRSLDQLTLGLHLDTMENTLRDDLLDVSVGTGIGTSALPFSIYPDRFTGFVEGWTWSITRKEMYLILNVSEYLTSVLAENWSQVNASEAWNTISATLEWQEARQVA
jgi:hypothetical protein